MAFFRNLRGLARQEGNGQGPAKERGSVLISVLWVIATMSIIVLALSFEARSDIERASLSRDRAKAYWMARGAIERAKYDYAVSSLRGDPNSEKKSRFHYQFDEGGAHCILQANSSMMSVNSSDRKLWDQLFRYLGKDMDESAALFDAIMDWRDDDDLPRLNGAESDYYLGLEPPYLPRNGAFYSVEELLLVRGITEEMFYGSFQDGVRKPGIQDVVSVNAPFSSTFDINSCPPEMLMVFLGITQEEADILVKAREEQPFENVQEAAALVPLQQPENINFFIPYRGGHFTVKATGYVHNSPARYSVEDEVRYTGNGKLYSHLSHKDFSMDHVEGESGNDEEME